MVLHDQQFHRLGHVVSEARRILLLNPERGDGDSFGSTLALAAFAEKQRKPVTVFSLRANRAFSFLPGFFNILDDPTKIDLRAYDLIITCDFADPLMTGIADMLQKVDRAKTAVVNIDHHPTNQRFGTFNILDPQSAATCEIVYTLFERERWPIDRDVATCLLTGILTDTNIFTNRNTTYRSLEIASKLVGRGGRMRTITDFMYRNKSVGALKLWGKALTRLQHNLVNGLVTTFITQQDLAECGVDDDAAAGVANFLNNLEGAKAVLVLRELGDGRIKGSFRTTGDEVDVAKLAAEFGGGGHRRAAGFTMKGRIQLGQNTWRVIGSTEN